MKAEEAMRRLRAEAPEATVVELAELAWLAGHFGASLASPRMASLASSSATPSGPSPAPPASSPAARAEVSLHSPDAPAPSGGGSSITASLSRPRDRRSALRFQRALHRLGGQERRGPRELDVAATVRASADADEVLLRWRASLSPAADLLVLEDPATGLWSDTVQDLLRMARSGGGFGRVLHQKIDPGSPETLAPIGEADRSLVVLLVSDGLGPGLTTGALLRRLRGRARDLYFAWVHPWGPAHWSSTLAGRLRYRPPESLRPGHAASFLGVPLVPLDPAGIESLVPWVHGRDARNLPARGLPLQAVPARRSNAPPLSWEQRADLLDRNAEAPTRELLGLAAVVPGSVDADLLIALGTAQCLRFERVHLAQAMSTGFLEAQRRNPLILRFREEEARRARCAGPCATTWSG